MINRRASSDSPWEKRYGYARAVRRGSFVAVSGTVACGADGSAIGSDAYVQTRSILARIERALEETGASLADVVRLRVSFADGDVADGFARALAERFPDGAPALTTVRVVRLVSDEFLLEIEADAVVAEAPPRGRPDEPVWDEQGD